MGQEYTDRNTPLYRLLAPCYLDDTLWPEGTEIYFTGTPNEEMEPLNALAESKSQDYVNMLDDAGRAVAASRNLPFLGRNAMIDQAYEAAHAQAAQRGPVALPKAKGEIPTRPDIATPAQRAQRSARDGGPKVLGTKAPAARRAPVQIGQTPAVAQPTGTPTATAPTGS